jgi:hypothetical protein
MDGPIVDIRADGEDGVAIRLRAWIALSFLLISDIMLSTMYEIASAYRF